MGDSYSGKGRGQRRNNENQKKQGGGRDEWTVKSSNQVPYPNKHLAVDCSVGRLSLTETPARSVSYLNPNSAEFEVRGATFMNLNKHLAVDCSIGRLSLTETPARSVSYLNPNSAEFEVRGATFMNLNNFQTSSQDGKPTPKPTGRLDNSYGRRNSNQGTQKSWTSIASSEPSNVYRTSIPFVPQFKECAYHNQNNFNEPATANFPDFIVYNIPGNSYKSEDHHDKRNSNEQSLANVTSITIKECAFYQNPQNEQSVKVSAPEENLAHIDGTDDNFKKSSSPLEGSQNTKSFYPRGKPYRESADNTCSSFSDRKRNGEHGKWNVREKIPHNEDEEKSNEWNKQLYNADKGKLNTWNKCYNADEGKSNAWNKQQYNPDEGKSKACNKRYNADEGKSNAWNKKQYNADEGKSTVSNKQPYNVDERKEFHENPQKEELNTRMEENSDEFQDVDETMQGEYASEVNKSCVLDDNEKIAGEGKYSDDKEKMIPELGGDESNYKNTTSQDNSSLTPDDRGAEYSRQVKSGSSVTHHYQKSGRDSRGNSKNDGTDTKKRADDKEKMPEEVRITGELDQYWDGNESSYKRATTRRGDSPLAPDDGPSRYWREEKSDSIDHYHYQKKPARDSRGNSKNDGTDTKKKADDREKMPEKIKIIAEFDLYWESNESSYKKATTRRGDSPLAPDDGPSRYWREEKSDSIDPYHYQKKPARDSRGNSKNYGTDTIKRAHDKEKMPEKIKIITELDLYCDSVESSYKKATTSGGDSPLAPDDGGPRYCREEKSDSIYPYYYQKKSDRDSMGSSKNDGTDTKKGVDDKEKMPEEVKITGELDQYWDGNESSYKKATSRRSDSPSAPDDGGPRYCREDKSDSVDPYHYQKKPARDSRGNFKNDGTDTKKRADDKEKMPEKIKIIAELDLYWDSVESSYKKATTRGGNSPLAPDDGGPRYCREDKSDSVDPYHYQKKPARDSRGNFKNDGTDTKKRADDKEKMPEEVRITGELDQYWDGNESRYKKAISRQSDSPLAPDGGGPRYCREEKSDSVDPYHHQKKPARDSRGNSKNDGTDKKKRADDKEKMPEEVRITGELDQYWDGNESRYKKATSRQSDSPLAPDGGGPRYCREEKSDSVNPYHYQKKSARDSRENFKNVSMQKFDTKKRVDLFDDYDRNYRNKNMVFKRVIEVNRDLFSAGTDYALAHCVAEDMNMGSGIALTFRKTFGCVTELLAQKEKQGGLAHLKHYDRNVYYLVVKKDSNKKPTLLTMFKSVNRLKEHMVANGVGKVAIPRLGCGYNRLEWSEVKNMLEYVFGDTEIEIKVFNYQQAQAQMEAKSTDHTSRKYRVNNLNTTIKDFYKKYTMILYLGTEQGDVTPEIKAIDKRFKMLGNYKSGDKKMGSYITTYKNNDEYCLIGIIAKKKKSHPFDFVAFGQAVTNLNKENQKAEKSGEKYGNAAIHRYEDPNDDIFMTKITNLLRNTFYKVEINLLDL